MTLEFDTSFRVRAAGSFIWKITFSNSCYNARVSGRINDRSSMKLSVLSLPLNFFRLYRLAYIEKRIRPGNSAAKFTDTLGYKTYQEHGK